MSLDELPLSKQIALYNDSAVAVPHEILSTWVGDADRLERERDAALAETKRLREWLAQRTAIVGTMFACEAVVSDTCIANHGSEGAALEACQRLRAAYALVMSKECLRDEGRRYHFALVVELPKGSE